MKRIRGALMMLAGAVVVHLGVTACSSGDGRAHADTAKTAQCSEAQAGTWVRVDFEGLSASDIVKGFAYGAVSDSHDLPGATLVQIRMAAGDGFAMVECASPGTLTVAVP